MHPGNAGSRWIFRSGITALSLPPPRQKTSRSHLAYHREIPAGRQYEKNNDVFPSHNLHILLFRQFPQGGIIMCCRAAHDASHFATPPFFITRRIYFSFFKKKMKEKALTACRIPQREDHPSTMRRQWTRCLPGNKSIHRLCKALENQTAGNRVPLKIQGWIFRKTVPLKPVRITPQETELSRIRPN